VFRPTFPKPLTLHAHTRLFIPVFFILQEG
jgi:hypothetical protein